MNLSAPFIQRPIMTILLMVSIFFVGLGAYFNLPISNMPNTTYPIINVTVDFPGTLPETMAHAVALPLEKQFMAIPGVKLVSSNNTLGNSSITLQFDSDKDMTIAAQDVQSAIITAQPTLPPQLPYAPVYRKVNPAELPILYLSLTSKVMKLNELYTYANNLIGQRLSMLNGVSQVTLFGSPLAIRIQVDPAKLTAVDLSLTELATAINLGNCNLSTGQLDGLLEAPNIAVDGQLLTSEAWENLIVAYRQGTPIYMRDLGRVVESFQDDKISVQRLTAKEEQPTILIAIQKEPTANAVAISKDAHDLIASLKIEIPPTVDVHFFFDRSLSIRQVIQDVNLTLLAALFLVILVVYFYLGSLKTTLIPAIVLPLSLIGTFIVMNLLQFTLDNLSLLSLILAVGFIIDDAIVVLENIVRRQEEGQSRWQASLEGAKQIGFTIVSMTLSLIAVFIPMLFMGGLIGKILREFALTLTIVTLISGMISLTLAPMLCSRFLPSIHTTLDDSKFAQMSKKLNSKMAAGYGKMLVVALNHRLTALMIGVLCLVATLMLFYYLPTDFLPNEDDSFFIAYSQGPEAGSTYQLLDRQKKILTILINHPAVEEVIAINSYSEYRKGQNLVRLKPLNKRASLKQVLDELNREFANLLNVQVFIKNVPLIDLAAGQESRGDYQFALQSIDADKVYASAKKLIAAMERDPFFQGVNSDLEVDSPQINVKILRDKASTLGITATDIENAFLYSYSYNYITRIETAIDQYDVILELLPAYQAEANSFNYLQMRSATSQKLIPLSAVAEWSTGLGASSVNHINQFPAVTISFNLASGVSLEQALNRLKELKNQQVDPTVSSQTIGSAKTFQESIQNAGYLLLIAIFVIYIILGMLYESFIHPLTVLSTLPPATLGGLLILFFFNLPLSLYAYLGIILLIGIVKKNGIMIVDFAIENSRLKHMNPREAIINACLVRFRPIMMTTVAAIFGALPIALGIGNGGAARQPLGLVIIAGLCLSQLITLFITPIIYLIMDNLNQRLPLHSFNLQED